jgi:hypothetical protein
MKFIDKFLDKLSIIGRLCYLVTMVGVISNIAIGFNDFFLLISLIGFLWLLFQIIYWVIELFKGERF